MNIHEILARELAETAKERGHADVHIYESNDPPHVLSQTKSNKKAWNVSGFYDYPLIPGFSAYSIKIHEDGVTVITNFDGFYDFLLGDPSWLDKIWQAIEMNGMSIDEVISSQARHHD